MDERHLQLRRLFEALKVQSAVMMEAYFDESGTHPGSPMMCVAGYLFDGEQALRLDNEWASVLQEFGIECFHMSDCAHGTREFARLTRSERDQVARRMIGIIIRRATIGVAVSMSELEFERLKPKEWKRGGAYTICCAWCIAQISFWADLHNYEGSISYFFESGHKHQGATNQAIEFMQQFPNLMKAARYHSHSFAPKKALRPLQAADLLAWEFHKDYTSRHSEPRRSRRLSLMKLFELQHMHAAFETNHLESFFRCGLNSIVRPSEPGNVQT